MNKGRFLAGFTLIELLVVIAIIGLLAGVVLVGFNRARLKARDVERKSDISQINRLVQIEMTDSESAPAGPPGSRILKEGGGSDVEKVVQAENPKILSGPESGPAPNKQYYYFASGSSYTIGAKLEDTAGTISSPKSCPAGGWNYCLGSSQ